MDDGVCLHNGVNDNCVNAHKLSSRPMLEADVTTKSFSTSLGAAVSATSGPPGRPDGHGLQIVPLKLGAVERATSLWRPDRSSAPLKSDWTGGIPPEGRENVSMTSMKVCSSRRRKELQSERKESEGGRSFSQRGRSQREEGASVREEGVRGRKELQSERKESEGGRSQREEGASTWLAGTSSVAKAWTGTFDDLLDNIIARTLEEHTPMPANGLSTFPDFFAAGIIMLLAGILAFGVKESAIINTVFTGVNVLVLVFIIIAGFIKGDLGNWSISPETILNATLLKENSTHNETVDFGVGGFFPFGFDGTLEGAATCFYAFVGFDCIATTGEEVQNPQKAIPLGIVTSLLICFLAYFGVSAALTLMMPYYLLDDHSPLPVAFEHVGWEPAKYVVAVGSLCALSTSLLGVMFPMPRVLFAMARDGLLFKPLCYLSSRQSPVVATLSSGAVAAAMVLLFDLKALVDLSSIGTIFAYTLVAVCILVLRYKEDPGLIRRPEPFSVIGLLRPPSQPTHRTSKNVNVVTIIILFLVIVLSVLLSEGLLSLRRRELWSTLIVSVLLLALVLAVAVIWRQPQNTSKAAFMVPGLPFIPVLSIFMNTYLMVQLGGETWISYAVWMAVGLIIYFGYGVRNSVQKQRLQDARVQLRAAGNPDVAA
ncbi:Cationic amino acid transporter 2 [Liparis tanakae]|uniref:Cationic amino acid transporter 2 n=1 Tax=Liparis tanakae TaxID=230148 RepID=A0A4Z2FW33_9TELE|nr:Cationic amino acid transporter 2 [Liparis tanakae]